jgi:hypothetical protein
VVIAGHQHDLHPLGQPGLHAHARGPPGTRNRLPSGGQDRSHGRLW